MWRLLHFSSLLFWVNTVMLASANIETFLTNFLYKSMRFLMGLGNQIQISKESLFQVLLGVTPDEYVLYLKHDTKRLLNLPFSKVFIGKLKFCHERFKSLATIQARDLLLCIIFRPVTVFINKKRRICFCSATSYDEHWLECTELRTKYEQAINLLEGTFNKALRKHSFLKNISDALERYELIIKPIRRFMFDNLKTVADQWATTRKIKISTKCPAITKRKNKTSKSSDVTVR